MTLSSSGPSAPASPRSIRRTPAARRPARSSRGRPDTIAVGAAGDEVDHGQRGSGPSAPLPAHRASSADGDLHHRSAPGARLPAEPPGRSAHPRPRRARAPPGSRAAGPGASRMSRRARARPSGSAPTPRGRAPSTDPPGRVGRPGRSPRRGGRRRIRRAARRGRRRARADARLRVASGHQLADHEPGVGRCGGQSDRPCSRPRGQRRERRASCPHRWPRARGARRAIRGRCTAGGCRCSAGRSTSPKA